MKLPILLPLLLLLVVSRLEALTWKQPIRQLQPRWDATNLYRHGQTERQWLCGNSLSTGVTPLTMVLDEDDCGDDIESRYGLIDNMVDDTNTAFDGDHEIETDTDNRNKRKVIRVSSQIELPFSAEIAYEAYSDLPRQPSWSSWLESVEVVNDHDANSNSSNDDDDDNNNNNQKVESKWTSKMMGIRYSWTAEAVKNERPHTIQWKSVTGLRNEGIVRFYHSKGKSYSQGPTLMTLQMSFVTPRAITSIIRRSKRLSNFVEEKMIARSLKEFRDLVLENDVAAKNGVEPSSSSSQTTRSL